MVRIEINGVFLDLFEDTSIKLNKKFTYFGDDDSSAGSFSYDFEIPLTKTNQEVIEYDKGHFNPDGISCLYYYTEKDYIKATFIVNSVDIFNKTASVCLLDDISYLSNISDSVLFQDLIDEEYTIGDATNEDNFWNIRYVDTLGTSDTDDDVKTVLIGCNDNDGVLPMTVNISRLCDAINSHLGTDISISEDDIEAIIPIKDFICRDFEDGQEVEYKATGNIRGAADLELYADSMSSKTQWLQLATDYNSISTKTTNVLDAGVFKGFSLYSETDCSTLAFNSKYFKGNKNIKFSIEDYSVDDFILYFAVYDSSITNVQSTYPISDFIGGSVALVLELAGKDITLKKGTVSADGDFEWNDAFSKKNLFNESIELESGEEYIPKLKLLALEEITFRAYNKEKGSLITYTWVGDTITGGDSSTTLLPTVYTISFIFSLNLKVIGYSDDIKYSSCGSSYNSAYLTSSNQPVIDVGCTLDTSGVKPIDLLKRYIKRFNASINSSEDSYEILSGDSSYNTIWCSKYDFDSVDVSNVSSLESIRSWQMTNEKGDTAYDEYSDETVLGSSDKISISDIGIKDKIIKLDSSIVPIELTDGINEIDESDAKVVSKYGAYFSGVFPSKRLNPSKYGVRFGFVKDDVKVNRFIQNYFFDEMLYSYMDSTVTDYVSSSMYSKDVKSVSIVIGFPYTSNTTTTSGYIYKGYVSVTMPITSHTYCCIKSIDGKAFSSGYLPHAYTSPLTGSYLSKRDKRMINGEYYVPFSSTLIFPFVSDDEKILSTVKISANGGLEDANIYTLKELSHIKDNGSSLLSLSFNDREAKYYEEEYVTALDYYFNPVKNYIYNANAIILEGEVTLKREDLATLYKSNTIIQIDGENWIPIQVENIDLSEKASKVKVKLCKEL